MGDAARKEIDEVGKKLAEALGEYGFLQLKPKEPGGLAEAFSEALRLCLLDLRRQQKDHEHFPQWQPHIDSWTQALSDFNGYYADGIEDLGRELHRLQNAPTKWGQLPHLLSLLDFATRLRGNSGNSSLTQQELPAQLAHILVVEAAPLFLSHFRKLLAEEKFKAALVAIALDAHARAPQLAPTRRQSLLSGPDDPLLVPMRGHFTGREDKIDEIQNFLQQPRSAQASIAVVTGHLYSVQGAPGIGKTECCKAALRQYLTSYPSARALYIDVTEAQNERGLLSRLAGALGDENLAANPAQLYALLSQSADLLYLDNLEDALPADRALSEPLFSVLEAFARSGVRILASCREKLGKVAREIPIGPLSATEAMEVFVHHFEFAVGHAAAALRADTALAKFLAEELAHHPLAIRLVASQAETGATWQTLATAWRNLRTAMANDEGRAGRLSNLDVSIGLSYARVKSSPEAATLWLALTSFSEGMSEVAQEAILPAFGNPALAVRTLKRYGLVDHQDSRLRMLAPLRQFARANCTEELPLIEDVCFNYFLDVARRAKETEFGDHKDRASRVAAIVDELPNIAEALPNFQLSEKTLSRLMTLHWQLHNSYQFRAFASIPLLEYMAHALTPIDLGRANTLKSLGDLESRLGQPDLARQHYNTARELYEREQDNLGRANTLKSLGDLERRLGQPDLARQHYNTARELFEKEQDNLGRANTLKALTLLDLSEGLIEDAWLKNAKAVQLYERENEPSGLAQCLAIAATLSAASNQKADAQKFAQLAREAAVASNNQPTADWVNGVLESASL